MQIDSNLDAQASFAGGFFPFLPAVNYHAEMTSGEDRMSAQEVFSPRCIKCFGMILNPVAADSPILCVLLNACRSVGKVILDNLGQFSVQCIANFG